MNPIAINNFGQIVGYTSSESPQAVLWQPEPLNTPNSPNGTLFALGTLGGAASYPTDINDNGYVTGYFLDGAGIPRVVLWKSDPINSPEGSSLISLNFPPLQGAQFDPSSIYGGINQSDVVASNAGPFSHAALYVPPPAPPVPPPPFPPKTLFESPDAGFYYVAAISKNGWITGSKTSPGSDDRAVCYKVYDLSSQPEPDFTKVDDYYYLGLVGQGQGDWETGSAGLAITEDDKGVVAVATGANGKKDNTPHAILWRPTIAPPDNIIDINLVLPAGTLASAYGINKSLQVVGCINNSVAFLYDHERRQAIDLNDHIDKSLGWILTRAIRINDFGQIIGTGAHSRVAAAFLLTPTRARRAAGKKRRSMNRRSPVRR
jgi:hypothetical protein